MAKKKEKKKRFPVIISTFLRQPDEKSQGLPVQSL